MEFTFSHPQYVFLLFLIPLIFFIHFWALGSRKKKSLKFANFDAIAKIEGIDFFSKNLVMLFINVLILLALVLAISGLTLHTTRESSAFAFVIAIDSSQSMEAKDLSPSRIDAAKSIASVFVDNLPAGIDVGIISFSGGSKIEKDLTQRKDELKSAISGIELSGYGGTDIYEAILTSSNLLKTESFKSIILLSDGQINVGNIDDAVEYANDNNVVVHAIGIGTKEGGETQYGISKLDEDSMKSLAYNTKGVYFPGNSNENLTRSFVDVLKLTRMKVAMPLFDYLIFLAIFLVVLEFFLSNTRYFNLI